MHREPMSSTWKSRAAWPGEIKVFARRPRDKSLGQLMIAVSPFIKKKRSIRFYENIESERKNSFKNVQKKQWIAELEDVDLEDTLRHGQNAER